MDACLNRAKVALKFNSHQQDATGKGSLNRAKVALKSLCFDCVYQIYLKNV